MSYKYKFEKEAQSEFYNSVFYYATISKDLAKKFVDGLKSDITKICENPYSGQIILNKVRKFHVSEFPFIIYYLTDEILNEILIIAVFHTSRNPKILKKRV